MTPYDWPTPMFISATSAIPISKSLHKTATFLLGGRSLTKRRLAFWATAIPPAQSEPPELHDLIFLASEEVRGANASDPLAASRNTRCPRTALHPAGRDCSE